MGLELSKLGSRIVGASLLLLVGSCVERVNDFSDREPFPSTPLATDDLETLCAQNCERRETYLGIPAPDDCVDSCMRGYEDWYGLPIECREAWYEWLWCRGQLSCEDFPTSYDEYETGNPGCRDEWQGTSCFSDP